MVELAMVASKVAGDGSEAGDGVADGKGRMGTSSSNIRGGRRCKTGKWAAWARNPSRIPTQ